MTLTECKIQLLPGGSLPTKAHPEDACYDVKAASISRIEGGLVRVGLGVALQPEPGYRVALYPRSSLSKTGWILANSVGVGDNNYTGEYQAYFLQVDKSKPFPYKAGERCLQIELVKYNNIHWDQVDSLLPTVRGDGGFGSTGQ